MKEPKRKQERPGEDREKNISAESKDVAGSIPLKSWIVSLVIIAVAMWYAINYQMPYPPWEEVATFGLGTVLSPGFVLVFLVFIFLINPMASGKKLLSFNQKEMVSIYILLLIGGILMSLWTMPYLISGLVIFSELAFDRSSDAVAALSSQLSTLIRIDDPIVTDTFWYGGSDSVPWGVWIKLITVWTLVIACLVWVILCVYTLFRRRWSEIEMLTFPLNKITLMMTENVEQGWLSSNLWRNKLLYAGMIWPLVYFGSQILHRYFPYVPMIPNLYNIGQRFLPANSPLMVPGAHLILTVDPFHIGLAYMLPTDITFSMWFFALWHRVEALLEANYLRPLTGISLGTNWGVRQKTMGGILGLAIFCIAVARHDIKAIIRMSFGKTESTLEQASNQEPIPFKVAFWGFIIGTIILTVFFAITFSMNPLVVVAAFVMLLAVMLSTARMRVEAGYPFDRTPEAFVNETLPPFLGSSAIRPSGYYFLGQMFSINYGCFATLMAVSAEAFKYCDSVNVRRREITKAIFILLVFTTVVGVYILLPLSYKEGFYMITARHYWSNPRQWVGVAFDAAEGNVPYFLEFTPGYILGVGYATVLSLLIGYMRTLFTWWPFHPVGYVIGINGGGFNVYTSYMIGWLVKALAYRYGGSEVVNRLYTFFVGLIIGSAFMNLIGVVLALLLGV